MMGGSWKDVTVVNDRKTSDPGSVPEQPQMENKKQNKPTRPGTQVGLEPRRAWNPEGPGTDFSGPGQGQGSDVY